MKLLSAVISFGIAGFCAFGFLATFEPGIPNAVAFRVTYIGGGITSLVFIVWLLASRNETDDQ